MTGRVLGVVAVVWAFLPTATAAQQTRSLAERAGEVENGALRFSFATRPDVLICDGGIRMGKGHQVRWNGQDGRGWDTNCRPGPAEVEARVRDGRIRDLEVLRRAGDGTPDARNLGTVAPDQAVAWLLSVIRDGTASASKDAVFPMILADVDRVWEPLLAVARDDAVGSSARKNALFWLGQEAAEVATEGLAEVARDEQEEQDVREAAVFALSQRPDEEGVPVLMELARTARQGETRRTALFWLAQSDAPGVVDFFAEILQGRGGG
jgi:hypothetical protein